MASSLNRKAGHVMTSQPAVPPLQAEEQTSSREAVAALLDGVTSLHAAALSAAPGLVELLLSLQADPLARTAAGELALELVPVCDTQDSAGELPRCMADAGHVMAARATDVAGPSTTAPIPHAGADGRQQLPAAPEMLSHVRLSPLAACKGLNPGGYRCSGIGALQSSQPVALPGGLQDAASWLCLGQLCRQVLTGLLRAGLAIMQPPPRACML